jgi:glycosyltransferase involved in cell wall biosynthesis
MKKLLIYDIQNNGHHLSYIRYIANAVIDDFDIVFAASTELRTSDHYKCYLESIASNIVIDDSYINKHKGILYSLFDSIIILKAIKKHAPSLCILPYADGVSVFLGIFRWFGFIPKNLMLFGINMRNNFCYMDKVSLLDRVKLFMMERCKFTKLFWLDSKASEWLSKNNYPLAQVSETLCEPVKKYSMLSFADACSALDISPHKKYIGIAGMLNSRKGIPLLLESMQNDTLPSDTCLLLAGKLSDDMALLIQKQYQFLIDTERVILINRFISENELLAVLAVLKVVCATYQNHLGSSGIVSLAISNDKVVVGCSCGWIGNQLEKYPLGLVYHDDKSFPKVLINAIEMAEKTPNTKINKFEEQNTIEKFQNTIRNGLL